MRRTNLAAPRAPRREKGIVLLVALTVLVAMSLAGVALMRSVDNTVVVAGNLAFKQASLQVADRGTQEAVRWLTVNSTGNILQNTNESVGYYATRPLPDPDWFNPDTWSSAQPVNGGLPDASGNIIRYVIHRMCDQEGPVGSADTPGGNTCILYYPQSTVTEGGSKAAGAPVYIGIPELYYRVTTRVEGPRNNITIIQSSVLLP